MSLFTTDQRNYGLQSQQNRLAGQSMLKYQNVLVHESSRGKEGEACSSASFSALHCQVCRLTKNLQEEASNTSPSLFSGPTLAFLIQSLSFWCCSQSDCCLQIRTTLPRIIGCVTVLFTFIETHRCLSSKRAHADHRGRVFEEKCCVMLKSCATLVSGHLATVAAEM